MEEISIIKNYFSSNGISLTTEQATQFYNYYLFLKQYNEKVNLTAITEFNDVIVKHFFDSAVCFSLFSNNSTLLDIGCGAGFPSIPLKIMNPSLKLTLVDSVNKKVTFCSELVNKLNLQDVKTIHTRAEDLAENKSFRESYDYVVSRAVASMNTLCEYCLPFVKIGGSMVAYKSTGTEEEVKNSENAIKILGGSVKEVKDFTVADYCRKVVIIGKEHPTPTKYPRKNNKPRTNPLA